MIDLHCHLLPGIDDGPATMQDALQLAREAVAAGTEMIVATPHISWDWPAVTPAVVADGVRSVRAALAEHGIALEVRAGGEVAMTRAVDLDDDDLRAVRLAGGPWLLLECPLQPSATGFEAVARDLQRRGHAILLAHPERSPAFQRDPSLLRRLVGEGMHAQLTASSFAGSFGRPAADAAWRMVEQGLVANVASDAHGPGGSRAPVLAPALVAAGIGEDLAHFLTADVPEAIVEGEPLPWPPPPAAARRRRGGRLARRLRGA